MSISVGASVDVPDMDAGVRFYTEAFGFTVRSQPMPTVVVLDADGMTLCLLEKKAGTQPSPNTTDTRRYERHWTPVHLDIHVPDLDAAIARAEAAGAKAEQVFKNPDYGSAAFCADPFGHGFCLIERKA